MPDHKDIIGDIVLVGLIYDENLGDQAISYVTTEIVKQYFEKYSLNMRVKYLDLGGATSFIPNEDKSEHASVKKRAISAIVSIVKTLAPRLCHDMAEKRIVSRFDSVALETITKETKAIIFCGGGIINFKHLFTSKPIYRVIQLAEQFNIPVMFSACGIEGFNPNDFRCKLLQRAMNSKVVKIITTRDDFKRLSSNYIKRSSIKTARVADSVCSINSFIPQSKKQDKTIGLGIAHPRLFKKYGIDCSEDRFLKLWINIIRELTNKGYKCRIFTNGAHDDYMFSTRVAQAIGDSDILESRPYSVETLASMISSYSGIIATRMHSAIIAYSYGVPAVGIVWNNKQLMFGKSIGRREYFIEARNFRSDVIVDKMIKFLEEGYDESKRDNYIASTSSYIEKFLNNYVFTIRLNSKSANAEKNDKALANG